MYRHMLVPTDGSALSDKAVNRAISFAKDIGARITFFYAAADYDASIYGEASLLRTLAPDLLDSATDKQAQEILSRAETQAKLAGIVCETLSTAADDPYLAIIAAAQSKQCDLILMASHGDRGVRGLILGSQTQKVLTHSTIPVLVYR